MEDWLRHHLRFMRVFDPPARRLHPERGAVTLAEFRALPTAGADDASSTAQAWQALQLAPQTWQEFEAQYPQEGQIRVRVHEKRPGHAGREVQPEPEGHVLHLEFQHPIVIRCYNIFRSSSSRISFSSIVGIPSRIVRKPSRSREAGPGRMYPIVYPI